MNTEDEAKRLIVATCSRGDDGNYYSQEMARSQDLETFAKFGQKLARVYELIPKSKSRRSKK